MPRGYKKMGLVMDSIHGVNEAYEKADKAIDEHFSQTMMQIEELFEQIVSNAKRGNNEPMLLKTPRPQRKKPVQRIETIPEDDVVTSVASSFKAKSDIEEDEPMPMPVRSRRKASQKAINNIMKQQSISNLSTKLRRNSKDQMEIIDAPKAKTRSKRRKESTSSLEDEVEATPVKTAPKQRKKKKVEKFVDETASSHLESTVTSKASVGSNVEKMSTRSSGGNKRKFDDNTFVASKTNVFNGNQLQRTQTDVYEPVAKKANIESTSTENETIVSGSVEASLYEDAVGKNSIVNSTMVNPNATFDKRALMNVSVVLQNLPTPFARMNETVTLSNVPKAPENQVPKHSQELRYFSTSSAAAAKTAFQENMKQLRNEPLLTDDDSSPEKPPRKKATIAKKPVPKYSDLISEESDYEPAPTPKKGKNTYKSAALFSPYAKESVKKRVEAFEQKGAQNSDDEDVSSTRANTRTKTRAMAAAEDPSKSLAVKFARKSLAKAKKISILKEMKTNVEEQKENTLDNVTKADGNFAPQTTEKQKYIPPAKLTTPLSKIRPAMPTSMSKYTTPKNVVICTSAEQFAATKSTAKKKMIGEASAEKQRKEKDREDMATVKRMETLKATSEQKKRKREEKEQRNKMLRDQMEKKEMEKRLKLEKEREEKARLAQAAHDKQREELEKKRLLQAQRMQEKEEKRRLEELARLKKKKEAEELERQLAEQKQKEVEAERRRLAEQKAQQALENQKLDAKFKAQISALKAQKMQNAAEPSNYVLESDPDEDESDDEADPKYPVPKWAKPEQRKHQLQMQKYIPMVAIHKMFSTKKCTPDLSELFQGYDKSKCKRNSSAIWKSPPRFSMMGD